MRTLSREAKRSPEVDVCVRHRQIDINGNTIFYREAGRSDAPLVLLPHGYPSSSFQYRNLMPRLAGRWRTIAPDYPGFGYSGTPDESRFDYTFAGYADFLGRFTRELGLSRYVLYLHDYGSWIGLRLAMAAPERVAGLIIQNGDIYEDQLGPKSKPSKPIGQAPRRRLARSWRRA